MILPRLKNYKIKKGSFTFSGNTTFWIGAGYRESAVKLFELFFKNIKLKYERNKSKADVVFDFTPSGKTEFYAVRIKEPGIIINYSGRLSLRNAIITLDGLLSNNKIRCCEIEDFSEWEYRGFMMDVARSYVPVNVIKYRIRELAEAKYNILRLHLGDSDHYAMECAAYPLINEKAIRPFYKAAEMRGLVEYAAMYGIEIIPEIDLPGHSQYLLSIMPELRCETDEKSIWAVCITNDKVYDFIRNILGEITAVFTSRYIHMGGDELCFYDLTDKYFWHTWDKCKRCQEHYTKNGYSDIYELFYYYLRRVNEIVKSFNRTMIVWNDGIDISKSPDLPKDIIIQFWRVASEGRGPSKGCNMAKFLEEGFKVINSDYNETYIDLYVSEEKLITWNPQLRPETPDKYKNNILGGEMCAWEAHKHYARTLSSAILLFSDRLWNSVPFRNSESIGVFVTNRILSRDACDDFDIYKLFGGYILPLNGDEKYYKEKSSKDISAISHAIDVLKNVPQKEKEEGFVIEALLECLTFMYEDLQNGKSIHAS